MLFLHGLYFNYLTNFASIRRQFKVSFWLLVVLTVFLLFMYLEITKHLKSELFGISNDGHEIKAVYFFMSVTFHFLRSWLILITNNSRPYPYENFLVKIFFSGVGGGGNSKTFSKDYFWGSGGIEILGKYLKISLTQQPAKKMTYPPLVMDKCT